LFISRNPDHGLGLGDAQSVAGDMQIGVMELLQCEDKRAVCAATAAFVGRPPSPAFHTYALLYLILFQAKTCLDEAFSCGQKGQGGNCFVETIDGCCRWAAFGYRASHCM
jgi:hypothetical protein